MSAEITVDPVRGWLTVYRSAYQSLRLVELGIVQPSAIVYMTWNGDGQAYQWASEDEGPGIQFEAYGPGTSYPNIDAENTGWYCYDMPDDDASDGPLSEAEALDWLWKRGPRVDYFDVREQP